MHTARSLEEELQCAYWQLAPPAQLAEILRRLGDGRVSSVAQRALQTNCLEHAISRQHPPGNAYSRRVLKHTILAAERDGVEADEALLQRHTALLLSTAVPDMADQWCHKTFVFGLRGRTCAEHAPVPSHITLRLSVNLLEGDTGCHEWEAGFHLAEFVLNHRSLVAGKRCLELGSGAGVVGCILARQGAAEAVLTDGDASTLANLRHNLRINGASELPGVRVEHLSWQAPCSLRPDVILGSDLIYDPDSICALVMLLRSLLTRPAVLTANPKLVSGEANAALAAAAEARHTTPVAYLATAVRSEASLQLFMQAAAGAQLHVRDCSDALRVGGVRFRHRLQSSTGRVVLHALMQAQA